MTALAFTNVTDLDCPHCNRLICGDWQTCPGYLRELVARLEQQPAERGVRQPMGLRIRTCPTVR